MAEQTDESEPDRRPQPVRPNVAGTSVLSENAPFLLSAIIGAGVGFLVYSTNGFGLVPGAVLGLIAGIAVWFVMLFVRAVEKGDRIGVERHWGGLGGSLGGSRLSAATTYLAGSVLFASLLAIAMGSLWQSLHSSTDDTPLEELSISIEGPTTVEPSADVTLTLSTRRLSEPKAPTYETEPLTYVWARTEGPSVDWITRRDLASVSFTAPGEAATMRLEVTVSGKRGQTKKSTHTVEIVPTGNPAAGEPAEETE